MGNILTFGTSCDWMLSPSKSDKRKRSRDNCGDELSTTVPIEELNVQAARGVSIFIDFHHHHMMLG